jgi:Meiotically up-regulated gene 113
MANQIVQSSFRSRKTGKIYCVRCLETGRIKIGFSQDPIRRVSSIQVASPTELTIEWIIDGSLDLEAQIHKDFCSYRVRGEWFHPDTLPLIDHIKYQSVFENSEKPEESPLTGFDSLHPAIQNLMIEQLAEKQGFESVHEMLVNIVDRATSSPRSAANIGNVQEMCTSIINRTTNVEGLKAALARVEKRLTDLEKPHPIKP